MPKLLGERLEELDSAAAGLNVEVVVVSLFLDAVKAIFVLILAVGNEARVFACPCWMRGPVVVQEASDVLVTATADLAALLLVD